MATIEKTIGQTVALPFREAGESFREFFLRVQREENNDVDADLPPQLEAEIAAIDRVVQRADQIFEQHGLLDDQTESLRRGRDARPNHTS